MRFFELYNMLSEQASVDSTLKEKQDIVNEIKEKYIPKIKEMEQKYYELEQEKNEKEEERKEFMAEKGKYIDMSSDDKKKMNKMAKEIENIHKEKEKIKDKINNSEAAEAIFDLAEQIAGTDIVGTKEIMSGERDEFLRKFGGVGNDLIRWDDVYYWLEQLPWVLEMKQLRKKIDNIQPVPATEVNEGDYILIGGERNPQPAKVTGKTKKRQDIKYINLFTNNEGEEAGIRKERTSEFRVVSEELAKRMVRIKEEWDNFRTL